MKPKCGVEGCNITHYAKGMCKAHYARVANTGKVGSPTVGPRRSFHQIRGTCNVKACLNPHYAHGLCQSHLNAVRWAERPTDGSRVCDVPGCGFRHVARGYCHFHYTAFQVRSIAARALAVAGDIASGDGAA